MAIDLATAIEIAVHAFAAGKSRTYPYTVRRVEDYWFAADDPPRKRQRKAELFAVDPDPSQVVAATQRHALPWHFLCDATPPGVDIAGRKAAYRKLGYRAIGTEWIFAHDLADIGTAKCDPPVRRVASLDEWLAIPCSAPQRRPWMPEVRQYCLWDAADSFGWVYARAVGEFSYTGDLHVSPACRGKGYGRALMNQLLLDDRSHGLRGNVLIASSDGARLYRKLSYVELGTLLVLCPIRSQTSYPKA